MAEKVEKAGKESAPTILIKKALVTLQPRVDRVRDDDEPEEDEAEEIENWPEDGKDNIIPVGREVVVSVHLAQRLVNAGRIKNFRIVTLQGNK
jgi:hypothetical protein